MVTAIILSGGSGSRLGSDIPKQYIEVAGKPVISYCLETLFNSRFIDSVLIVAAENWQEYISKKVSKLNNNGKFIGYALPGKTRQLSIYNGLKAIEKYALQNPEHYVFIHDAARPLLSENDIASYVTAARGHDGVLPVLPMKDTVYLSDDGMQISSLLNRKKVFAGQAPEFFVYKKYLDANERLITWSMSSNGTDKLIAPDSDIYMINGSTEPAIMAGMDICIVPGNESNFKITTAEDFARFKIVIRKRCSADEEMES
ncbi:MAG TPA: 2-C-methyl-D-erythritol 4-phosphate cytidylyltransferase [Lachnoclostridium phytofermentans]|uniref:2-C-methyl-D-erythritol 4-phosphate cytidylyltransferase n=2 Tax=Lachnoclostridium TaxID=1506553 RepID=A0A3D2X192_9FIRM|nr:2-C-methyl-D-erythritol 4-phosphate cytidylyltransferase [Lachnoclostridium phytofermentans]